MFLWNALTYSKNLFTKRPAEQRDNTDYIESHEDNMDEEVNETEIGFADNVNLQNEKRETALHKAVRKGNEPFVKEQLEKGLYNIDTVDRNGNSILHLAAAQTTSIFTQHILDANAYVNLANDRGQTPLHCAVINSALSNVTLLLDKNANPNAATYSMGISSCSSNFPSSRTPLHLAFQTSLSVDIVQKLIDKKADFNLKDSFGDTPFSLAVQHKNANALEGILNTMLASSTLEFTNKILHLAASNNAISAEMFEKILNKALASNARLLDTKDNHNDTTLCCLLKRLLGTQNRNESSSFSKCSSSSQESYTFVYPYEQAESSDPNAIKKLLTDKLDLLLKKNPDPNLYGNSSPLHLAAELGDSDLIYALHQLGAKINAQNSNKDTPLQVAVNQDNIPTRHLIVQLLIDLGADLNAKNCQGNTPLHLAVLKEGKILAEMLLNAGANVNIKDAKKNTPLVYAANSVDLINILAKGQLDLTSKSGIEEGRKALKQSLLANNIHAAKLLISIGCDPLVHIYPKDMNAESDKISTTTFAVFSNDGLDKTGLISKGDTPLHFAVKIEDEELATACLKKHPQLVNSLNDKGVTPAALTVKMLVSKMANLLYKNGAQINQSERCPGVTNNIIFGSESHKTLLMTAASRMMTGEELENFFKDPDYQLTEAQKKIKENRKPKIASNLTEGIGKELHAKEPFVEEKTAVEYASIIASH
jgi:ankyrin repeat protein